MGRRAATRCDFAFHLREPRVFCQIYGGTPRHLRLFKEARRLVQEAMEIVTGWSQLYWISPLRAFQAYIALREGDVAWAEAELAKLPRSTFHKPSIHKELEQLAYVRLLLAKQQEADALKILAPLKQIGVREGLLGSQVEIANLQAMALQQQGNKREALAHLHEALVIGAKNLYVRSFLDEGLAMYSLLSAYQTPNRKGPIDQALFWFTGKPRYFLAKNHPTSEAPCPANA
ncbi:MAG: hypothetical protein ACQEU7_13510 [Bacillota bacterium]